MDVRRWVGALVKIKSGRAGVGRALVKINYGRDEVAKALVKIKWT